MPHDTAERAETWPEGRFHLLGGFNAVRSARGGRAAKAEPCRHHARGASTREFAPAVGVWFASRPWRAGDSTLGE